MTQLCQLSSKFFLVAFRGKCFVSPCLFNGFPHKKKIITSKTAKYSLPSTLAGFFRQCDSFKLLCTQFLLGQSLEDSANVWFNIKRIVRGSVCHMLLT